MAAVVEFQNALSLQLTQLATEGFESQPQIIGRLFPTERQLNLPVHAHIQRRLRAQGQQLKEAGQPFPRGFATQEQHPVAGCIQFIQRHFQ